MSDSLTQLKLNELGKPLGYLGDYRGYNQFQRENTSLSVMRNGYEPLVGASRRWDNTFGVPIAARPADDHRRGCLGK
jgi:hypothetical protein